MYELTSQLVKKYRVFCLHFTILVLNVLYCDGKCGTGYALVAKSVIEEECILHGSDTGLSFKDCTKQCNHIENCVYFVHQGIHNNCSVCLEAGNVFEAHHLTMIENQFSASTKVYQKQGYIPLPGSMRHSDCADWKIRGATADGEYTVYPDGVNQLKVYCDMTTEGGGWTVFQRRQDGSQDFQQPWNAYKNGFGNISAEFWLGNEHVSILTGSKVSRLRVDLVDFSGNTRFAVYEYFLVFPESDDYKLQIGTHSGTAGDNGEGLSHVNGMKFTTVDRDNDLLGGQVCSAPNGGRNLGGFWFKACSPVLLNSEYPHTEYWADNDNKNYMKWFAWYTDRSLRRSEFKFRPMQFP